MKDHHQFWPGLQFFVSFQSLLCYLMALLTRSCDIHENYLTFTQDCFISFLFFLSLSLFSSRSVNPVSLLSYFIILLHQNLLNFHIFSIKVKKILYPLIAGRALNQHLKYPHDKIQFKCIVQHDFAFLFRISLKSVHLFVFFVFKFFKERNYHVHCAWVM